MNDYDKILKELDEDKKTSDLQKKTKKKIAAEYRNIHDVVYGAAGELQDTAMDFVRIAKKYGDSPNKINIKFDKVERALEDLSDSIFDIIQELGE